MAWSPKEGRRVEEVSADVCVFEVREDGFVSIYLNKYPKEILTELPVEDAFVEFEELGREFPRLRCNEIYILTGRVPYTQRKRFFRRFRKVLSKIESNWLSESTPRIHLLPEYPEKPAPEIYLKRR